MIRLSPLPGALLASALVASPGAFAQALVGGTVLNGGVPSYSVNATAPFTVDQGTLALRVFVVNDPGKTSGPFYVGQYSSTPPSFANGQAGYLSVDASGRLILAPGAPVQVSNFPSTQAVSGTVIANQGTSPWAISGAVSQSGTWTIGNGGTFAVQNTAAELGTVSTAAPSYSNGSVSSLSLTPAGALRTDSSATTQPVSSTTLSTAANQATEIANLQVIGQRSAIFTETNGSTIAASAQFTGAIRDLGAAPAYSRVNALAFSSTQTATLTIQACFDAACTLNVVAATASVPSGNTASASAVATTRYYRTVITNSSASASTNIAVSTSFTAN